MKSKLCNEGKMRIQTSRTKSWSSCDMRNVF